MASCSTVGPNAPALVDLGHWGLAYWCLIRSHPLLLAVISAFRLAAQSNNPQPETWNIYFQATSVGQTHPSFRSLVGYAAGSVQRNVPEWRGCIA